MSADAPPSRDRLKALPWFLCFVAIGVFSAWLALSGLLPTLRALAAGAAVVSFQPHDLFGLPPALSCFAFAAMTLLPAPDVGPGRRTRARKSRSGVDWAAVLLGVAVAGAILTVVAAPIGEALMASTMHRRGYLHCPAPLAIAHAPPMRWARPDAVTRCFHG